MTKDEIWNKLKNDKSEVYNETIFKTFLKVVEKLNIDHFLEVLDMSSNYVNSLNDNVFFYSLRELYTSDASTGKHIYNNIVEKIISKKEVINEDVTYWILRFSYFHDIEENAKKLGNRVKKISDHHLSDIYYFREPEEMCKIFGERLEKMSIGMIVDIISKSFRFGEKVDENLDCFGGLESIIIRIIDNMPKLKKVGWGTYNVEDSQKTLYNSGGGWTLLSILLDGIHINNNYLYEKTIELLLTHSNNKADFQFVLLDIIKRALDPVLTFRLIKKFLGNRLDIINNEVVTTFILELLEASHIENRYEILKLFLQTIDIKKIVEDLRGFGDDFEYEVKRLIKNGNKEQESMAQLIIKYLE
jgi:hypothetical protein